MATDCTVHTKWHDEDALSLCDLPLDDQPDSPPPPGDEQEFEFDFGSLSCSVLNDQEMCTADEVFFKGQIMPLRLSLSSRTASRSESMDRSSSAGFTSRSSSINSSSTTSKPYKPKPRNQFHAHPSPTPKIRTSGSRTSNRSRRWSVWDLFRLGPVQTPEIELEDLKVRTSNYKSSTSTNGKKGDGSIKKSGGFLGGCKCSVETMSFESVMARSKSTSSGKNGEGTRDAKQQEMKKKKKTRLSSHRTFEWLKELSHASTPHHQILV